MPPLELDLEQPDDAVMLQLLTDGSHQDRTHEASGRRKVTGNVSPDRRLMYSVAPAIQPGSLTHMSFPHRMMR
jgi:hypothetical protein